MYGDEASVWSAVELEFDEPSGISPDRNSAKKAIERIASPTERVRCISASATPIPNISGVQMLQIAAIQAITYELPGEAHHLTSLVAILV